MNNLIIRRARREDLTHIIDFNLAMALETENKNLNRDILKAGVENLFAQPQYGFYCVAESAERMVGQLMITYEWSDWRNGLFWWIQSVYIHPDFRSKGIFTKMYEFIRRESSALQVCGIRLYVDKSNNRAKNVYIKCGMNFSHYDMLETDFVLGKPN